MKVGVFNAKSYDESFLTAANAGGRHDLHFIKSQLGHWNAKVAAEFECVSAFVNDVIDDVTLEAFGQGKTKLLALRCAGFNNVDLPAAEKYGISVVRVPAYSPYAVAEHVLALVMTLYRKTHRAFNRVREANFSLEGLIGAEIHGRTVGIIGTGKIGVITAGLFRAFGCEVVAFDVFQNPELEALGAKYVSLDTLFERSDIISLHCPLNKDTRHIINDESVAKMKDGVTLINTSRGGLVATEAVYQGLKTRKIGYLGIDVYEEEAGLFFEDRSGTIIDDDLIMRLTTFPNVLITGHQAFFTDVALKNIADTTLANITEFEETGSCKNRVAIS